jgi:exosome complex component MTR3
MQAADGKTLRLDPTEREAAAADACVTVGAMPALGQVTSVHLTGEAELDAACEVSDASMKSAPVPH